MKKFLKMILILLILIFIGITIYNINIVTVWGLDKSNSMSKEEIIELLEKGTKNQNYMYSIVATYSEYDVQGSMNIFVKDNVVAVYSLGKPYYWIDLNNKEKMEFKNYFGPIVSVEQLDEKDITYLLDLKPDIIFADYLKTKYLGEKNINGRITVVIETSQDYSDYEDMNFLNKIEHLLFRNFYFIDKETGILIKREFFMKKILFNRPSLIIEKIEDKYDVKFNCVTNEDIKRPNLEGYTIQSEDIYNQY